MNILVSIKMGASSCAASQPAKRKLVSDGGAKLYASPGTDRQLFDKVKPDVKMGNMKQKIFPGNRL